MTFVTAVGVRKTLVLHKQIKNRPNLAYKNSVRKCYEDMFLSQIYVHFNNPIHPLKLKINN